MGSSVACQSQVLLHHTTSNLVIRALWGVMQHTVEVSNSHEAVIWRHTMVHRLHKVLCHRPVSQLPLISKSWDGRAVFHLCIVQICLQLGDAIMTGDHIYV